ADNLGKVVHADVCVHADAGLFLASLLERREALQRPCDRKLPARIAVWKKEERKLQARAYETCGVDPMHLILALRRHTQPDCLFFVDVALAEHFAAEAFSALQPRTYFNPTDNQAMGWSIPAALGAQKAHPCRQVITLTGDGCFLMSGME